MNIPEAGETGFENRLASLVEADERIRSQRVYVVGEGDSLSGIAQKFDIPVAALLIWNRLRIDQVIHPGQRLVVFPDANGSEPAPTDANGDRDG